MNWGIILRLLLPEILSILQLTIKNPASVASELSILESVYAALGALITQIKGSAPTA